MQLTAPAVAARRIPSSRPSAVLELSQAVADENGRLPSAGVAWNSSISAVFSCPSLIYLAIFTDGDDVRGADETLDPDSA